MTKRKRQILFWISVFLFVGGVIPLVLYSFGYRFSYDDGIKLQRAGGLSVRVRPATGASIFVDGEMLHETTLLSRRLFLQGLTPRPYHVQVFRDGYHPWEKVLRVYPERVTDVEAFLMKNTPEEPELLMQGRYDSLSFFDENESVLTLEEKRKSFYYSIGGATILSNQPDLPERATTTDAALELPSAIDGFSYDAGGNRALWWRGGNVWVKWLGDEGNLPLYTEEREMLIFSSDQPIRDAQFYPHREAAVVTVGKTITVLELDGRSKRNEYIVFSGKSPFAVVSAEHEAFFILDDGKLFRRSIF